MRKIIAERINELGALLRSTSKHTYEYRQIESLFKVNMRIWEVINE